LSHLNQRISQQPKTTKFPINSSFRQLRASRYMFWDMAQCVLQKWAARLEKIDFCIMKWNTNYNRQRFRNYTWLLQSWKNANINVVYKFRKIVKNSKKYRQVVLVNDELDAQFFSYMVIPVLYMFRAPLCSSSKESIASIRRLVYVTLCRWHKHNYTGGRVTKYMSVNRNLLFIYGPLRGSSTLWPSGCEHVLSRTFQTDCVAPLGIDKHAHSPDDEHMGARNM
jgi:hypothetical protein